MFLDSRQKPLGRRVEPPPVSSEPMGSTVQTLSVPVTDGAVPVHVTGPDDLSTVAGVVVVPSIFGANDDLLAQMASLGDVAQTAVMDPFWRQGAGALPYTERDEAFARVGELDRARCRDDVAAVARWSAERTNGRTIGLGICFGGPWVLTGAASGLFAAAVTWHGSRMEGVLDRLHGLSAPLRLHFGDADPITPPEVIESISEAFAEHPDCTIVIHPGADHGFSHEGPAWDPVATAAGMADLRALAVALGG